MSRYLEAKKIFFLYSWPLFVCAVVFLIFFRPLSALRIYMNMDDLCYLQWLSNLVGGDVQGCSANWTFLPGSAVVWLPAGLIGTIFFRGPGEFLAAVPIFVGVLSFLYWCGSFFLLDKIFQKSLNKDSTSNQSQTLSFLFLFAVPVLYYAVNRTTMVHTPEVFLVFSIVYFLQRQKIEAAILCSLVLVCLRLNDFPAVFVLAASCLSFSNRKRNIAFILAALGLVGVLLLEYGFLLGYHHKILIPNLIAKISFARIAHVFLGGDWGLVWSAPAWIFCLAYGVWKFPKLSSLGKSGVIWMGLGLLICTAWSGHGGDFGYRYLLGAYGGALLVFLDLLKSQNLFHLRLFKIIAAANGLWLLWLNWVYRQFGGLNPEFVEGIGWTQLHLQQNAVLRMMKWSTYEIPFHLSPLGILYHSIFEAKSVYSLFRWPGASLKVWVLGTTTSIALLMIFYFLGRIGLAQFRKNFCPKPIVKTWTQRFELIRRYPFLKPVTK